MEPVNGGASGPLLAACAPEFNASRCMAEYSWTRSNDGSACLARRKPPGALRRANSAPSASSQEVDKKLRDELAFWRSKEGPPTAGGTHAATVTTEQRCVLVDWLAELRDEYRLQGETLFLAAAYLDRFLAAAPLELPCLQLLGLACLWVAAKLHEVRPPPGHSLLAMACGAYSLEELLSMEKRVLFTLQFDLTLPTPFRFLHYLLELSPLPPHPDAAARTRRLAEALLELSLLDTAFLLVPPSAVAATAVYAAMEMTGAPWGLGQLATDSGAEPTVLGALAARLVATLNDRIRQHDEQQRWERDRRRPQPDPPCALFLHYTAWAQRYGFPLRKVELAAGFNADATPQGGEPAAAAAAAQPLPSEPTRQALQAAKSLQPDVVGSTPLGAVCAPPLDLLDYVVMRQVQLARCGAAVPPGVCAAGLV